MYAYFYAILFLLFDASYHPHGMGMFAASTIFMHGIINILLPESKGSASRAPSSRGPSSRGPSLDINDMHFVRGGANPSAAPLGASSGVGRMVGGLVLEDMGLDEDEDDVAGVDNKDDKG